VTADGPESVVLRAFNSDGTQELVGTYAIPRPEAGEQQQRLLVAAATELFGRPVAILGEDDADTVYVEVLEPPDRGWVDAALPEGWRERAPWRQPGWYAATVERIDAALADASFRRTGDAVQAKHWSISALLEVPTDRGPVWFKQVPPMFAHEGRLNTWLADLAPHAFARPLAEGTDWWLVEGMPDARPVPAGAELGAIDLLTSIQRLSIDRAEELLGLGCPDRRLPVLLREVAHVAERDDVLPAATSDELLRALPLLGAAVERLEEAGLPDNPGARRLPPGQHALHRGRLAHLRLDRRLPVAPADRPGAGRARAGGQGGPHHGDASAVAGGVPAVDRGADPARAGRRDGTPGRDLPADRRRRRAWRQRDVGRGGGGVHREAP